MAATAVPVTEITRSGVAPPSATTGDTVNGHSIANDGSMYFSVANSLGVTGTVTITVPRLIDGQSVASRVITIPANATEHRIGPFPTASYGTTLNFTVSATTLTLRAYHFTPGS
jgi:hypothetical protein